DKLDLRLLQDHLEIRTWDLTEERPVQVAPFELANSPFALVWHEGLGIRIQHDGEPMAVSSIAISADGKFAAFAGWPLRIKDGEKVPAFALVRSSGGRLIVWDVAKAQVHAIHNAPTTISAVAFAPDGRLLAIGNHDGVISIATPDAVKPPRLLVGHRGYIGA